MSRCDRMDAETGTAGYTAAVRMMQQGTQGSVCPRCVPLLMASSWRRDRLRKAAGREKRAGAVAVVHQETFTPAARDRGGLE